MSDGFGLDVDVLREVLNHLNSGIYVTDRKRRILLWNKKAEEITGHKAEDLVGTGCWDGVLNHTDKDGHKLCSTRLCPLYRAMERNQPSGKAILVYTSKAGGRRVPLSVSVAPLRDDKGEVVGGIEMFTDESASVADLEFAGKIQTSLMPKDMPHVDGYSFDARYYPRDLVGGDFYDLREIGDGVVAFMAADVRGHGVSAALYTMWIRSLQEILGAEIREPSSFMSGLNSSLADVIVAESFATAVCGVVDTKTHEVTYSSAGHPPLLHYHASGEEVSKLESHGMPLGILSDEEYGSSTISLAKGDVLLAYTDGITEVETTLTDGGMLAEDGLAAVLADEAVKGRDELLERIYIKILDSSKQVSLDDDVLLLSISRDR